MIEEKVLFNVLQQVSKGETETAAPDREYILALESIGFIKLGWNNELTEMGRNILEYLRNKLQR